jgi:hypothetical protein
MRDDFDPPTDQEVESRLRQISHDPEPQLPARVFRYVDAVAGGTRPGLADVQLEPLRGPRLVPRPARRAIVGLAATLILAVAGAALLVAVHPNKVAAPPASRPWTALEWHDVTSTAFPATSSAPGGSGAPNGPESVITWKGRLLASISSQLWWSSDGIHWQQVKDAPGIVTLVATKDWLLELGSTCQGLACGTRTGPVEYSTDGLTWKVSQFPPLEISGVAAANDRAVILTKSPDAVHPGLTTSVPHVSVDGATWQVYEGSMPADMAAAWDMAITSTRAGFVASGLVADPNGADLGGGIDSGVEFTLTGSYRYWFSADGRSWAPYAPGLESAYGGILSAFRGSAGDALADGRHHSRDGLTWLADANPLPRPGAMAEAVPLCSDGAEILGQGLGPTFYVSRGDGLWLGLQNGGDVGSLPQGGQAWVVPGGVIYDGGGRVFFGKALSGVTLDETLAPGPTVAQPSQLPVGS